MEDTMSVEADLSGVRNSDIVCWEYTRPSDETTLDDGWEPTADGLMMRMCPKTAGIIMASGEIHLNHISPTNILEWIYRLDSFFDVDKGYLATWTEEGEVPIRLSVHDIKDHIGLRTNIKNWTKERVDRRIRELRIVKLLENLNSDL